MRTSQSASDQLLRHVEALFRAIDRRDAMRVVWLLGDALAVHLPREVFEEALALSRVPRDSFRAPIHLLRHYHRTRQLFDARPARDGGLQLAFSFDDAVHATA